MIRRLLSPVALLFALPVAGAAQDRLCTLDTAGLTTQEVVMGDTVVIIHDPFTVNCTDGVVLRANSGRLNRAIRELDLQGDVFFEDSIQSLTSEAAIYNSGIDRLFATGDVVFTNRQEGSTLEGPELEYYRATDERPLSQVTAGQRPTLAIQPGDGAEGEPLNLIADHVLIIGEDDLTATGNVVITRTDFDASAGEARYNSATEDLELRQDAILHSEDYDLAGDVVQAQLVEGQLEHVHARTRASLTGEDLEVTAPDLQLFFANDLLQRAVATAPPDSAAARAIATSRTFRLEADSLDANFLDQELELVHAVGSARGETIDTLAVEVASAAPADADSADAADSAEADADAAEADSDPDGGSEGATSAELDDLLARDWITGDTITGFFARAAPDSVVIDEIDPDVDLAAEEEEAPVELQRLVAVGSAQSLYRMVPEGGTAAGARRNVNFLVGDRIELELLGGELHVALVDGLQQGVYLEALPESEDESPSASPPEEDVQPDTPVDDPTPPIAGNDDA